MLDRSFSEPRAHTKKRQFIWHHCISFEETNVVGNVYFARHLSWQGKCREMFLKAHAPGTLDELSEDLRLVTLSVACNYFDELVAFDDIALHMSLAHLNQHRIGLDFAYVRAGDDPRTGQHVAQGFQEIGCMRLAEPKKLLPCSPPSELLASLTSFA